MELVPRRTALMSPSSSWLTATIPEGSPTSPTGASRGGTLRNTAKLRGSKSLPWLHSYRRQNRPHVAVPDTDCTAIVLAGPVGFATAPQQTARGWLATYDNRLSQNFWRDQQEHHSGGASLDSERLPPIASRTAKRENFKKEHYGSELDRIVERNRLVKAPRASVAARISSLEAMEKEVNSDIVTREFGEIDELLQRVSKAHRNFKPQNPEQQELTKQEEKHETSEAIKPAVRKRKKKTMQPGNPKWRVEQRLKWAREEMKETGEMPLGTNKLPMTQFAVQGDKGKEEHTLVDVQALQAKCKGLRSSCSAKSLLDLQRLREEEANAKANVAEYCQADLDAFAALSWEDRVDQAQRRKLEGHISSVFNKMSQMRGKYPKDVPDSLLNHLQAMSYGDFSWHEEVLN